MSEEQDINQGVDSDATTESLVSEDENETFDEMVDVFLTGVGTRFNE